MAVKGPIVPVKQIESLILNIRGQRVMLDADMASIYGVSTKRLNEQVKRNKKRFPEDFMFQLTEEESKSLRSQFATSKEGRGGRRYLPYAFTEHGAIMAANVLNSELAVEMSVYVVRAFVRLREFLAAHKELAIKFSELERKLATHDRQILEIVKVIKELMAPQTKEPKKIGFRPEKRRK